MQQASEKYTLIHRSNELNIQHAYTERVYSHASSKDKRPLLFSRSCCLFHTCSLARHSTSCICLHSFVYLYVYRYGMYILTVCKRMAGTCAVWTSTGDYTCSIELHTQPNSFCIWNASGRVREKDQTSNTFWLSMYSLSCIRGFCSRMYLCVVSKRESNKNFVDIGEGLSEGESCVAKSATGSKQIRLCGLCIYMWHWSMPNIHATLLHAISLFRLHSWNLI